MKLSLTEKIIPPQKLAGIAKKLKTARKRIVLCHGVFDLIHPGHIKHLNSAKEHGDILIVTITGDKFVRKGPGRPIFNENLRAEVLAAMSIVDYVSIIHNESAIEAIKKIRPDIYVKGPDYKTRKINPNLPQKLLKEKEIVEAMGGKILYTTDDVVFSSSSLINQYLEAYPEKTRSYLANIRQNYASETIIDALCALKSKKILVIGDAIIDEYNYTSPMGKSSKEPLVVHSFRGNEAFAGGVLATANHLAALSDHVTLVTVLGKKKSWESFIRKNLKSQITPVIFHQPDAQTIVKSRFIDEVTNQKLFQVSYMKNDTNADNIATPLLNYLKKELTSFDLVIVNDFGHGMLTPKLIRYLCKRSKFLALNVQANSANYGFNVVTKYPRADFVCMDEHEIRLATHDRYGDLLKLIRRVAKKLECKELVVTRGSEGSVSFTITSGFSEAPALSQSVVDRVGAGDAFFAIASPCAHAGFDQILVSFLGNVSGALKVQTIGNKQPINLSDITKFITRLLK